MTEEFEDTSTLGGSVLPPVVEEVAVPVPLTQLAPWHHPRKQYIRERQWKLYGERFVSKLIDQQRLPSGLIKYLTLPGLDYFDVEILGQSMSGLGVRFEATGFHAELEKESIRARSQFRAEGLIKRGVMEDTSITFPYRFEDLARVHSQPYREIAARAPFQIVNIDACGSVARPSADQPNRIIDAIFHLMRLQFERSGTNWLMFVTTDARNENLSEPVKGALKDAIRANSLDSAEFSAGAIELLASDSTDSIDVALSNADQDASRFMSMFNLGFSKWLLHTADTAGWDVKFRQSYCYSTRPEGEEAPSMVCMAFEFCQRPVPIRDRFGAVATGQSHDPDPGSFSMQALHRATTIENLDSILEGDASLRNQFSLAQRDLLVRAGYQATALEEFDSRFS